LPHTLPTSYNLARPPGTPPLPLLPSRARAFATLSLLARFDTPSPSPAHLFSQRTLSAHLLYIGIRLPSGITSLPPPCCMHLGQTSLRSGPPPSCILSPAHLLLGTFLRLLRPAQAPPAHPEYTPDCWRSAFL